MKTTSLIELNEEEIRKIQMVQLELLKEVDRICKNCGIHYNIIAGTLLGAVREKGFLPWDDDADVAFLRDEYEKFSLACKTELDESKFYFQDNRNTPGYRWGYGKLRRKGTVFLRRFQEHMPYEQGIFIDIFPLDYVSNNYLLRTIDNLICFLIRKALWSAVGRISEKSRIKHVLYELLYKIPEKKILLYYNNLVKRCNSKTTNWVRILTFPTPNCYFGYLAKWYLSSEAVEFENYFFSGIKLYDEYLTFKYGEYMIPPPKEKQKTHPISQLKLLD